MKAGDKVVIDGEEATVMHVTPSYPEGCTHDFTENTIESDDPFCSDSVCKKCGMSWVRHIFTECP